MEVSDILSKAWVEVQKAGLPTELHPAALREAIRLLTEPQGQTTTKQAGRHRPRPAPHADAEKTDGQNISEDDFFDGLSRETGVSREDLEQIFHLDKGVPQLNLPARRLGGNTKVRIVTVAQLIPVARQYGLGESETSTKVVRAECNRLHCLDDKNFNTYVGKLDGITYAGPSGDKKLKVRPPAVTAFERIVGELISGEAAESD